MEKYYWLSACDRRNVLLQTFVKSWKWIMWSIFGAFILYFLFDNLLKNSPFVYVLSLLTSLGLFLVTLKKDKLLQKSVFCYRFCYVAATSVILFWMLLFNGVLCFFLFLGLACLLFFASPLLNKLPFELSEKKVLRLVFLIILCFLFINLGLILFNVKNDIFIATTFCLIFMFFNAIELKQMDKLLQKGLTEEELQNMTENWSFDMFGNYIGMLFFSDSVRFISKIFAFSKQKKVVV